MHLPYLKGRYVPLPLCWFVCVHIQTYRVGDSFEGEPRLKVFTFFFFFFFFSPSVS